MKRGASILVPGRLACCCTTVAMQATWMTGNVDTSLHRVRLAGITHRFDKTTYRTLYEYGSFHRTGSADSARAAIPALAPRHDTQRRPRCRHGQCHGKRHL